MTTFLKLYILVALFFLVWALAVLAVVLLVRWVFKADNDGEHVRQKTPRRPD